MRIEIYVDGSYTRGSDTVYGGYVILYNNTVIMAERLSTKDKRFVKSWNVGGELMAAATAAVNGFQVKKALEAEGYDCSDRIVLYHDYTGIDSFVTKSSIKVKDKDGWVSIYRSLMQKVINDNYPDRLVFQHVRSHTGNKWNEIADGVASGRITHIDDFEVEERCMEFAEC